MRSMGLCVEIILVVGSAFAAAPSLAAPVVTAVAGPVAEGEAITIFGTGFGTKSPAAPLVFDDFEAGTVGARVESRPAAVGRWGSGDWSYAVSYSGVSPLDGAKVAHHAFNSVDYNASLYLDPAATQTLYMDFWIRAVPQSAALTRNWKPWRLYDSADADVANDVVFCDSPGWVGVAAGGGGWVQRPRAFNEWEHFQVTVRLGANGIFAQYRDGLPDAVSAGFNNGASISQVRIGHYWATSADQNCPANPGADVFTDLVYVDSSLARVVIGDAPTFLECRSSAILIPTAWSGTQITARVKAARLAPGSSAYLFVVDADNVASDGYPITFGQDPVAPNPPTALTVR